MPDDLSSILEAYLERRISREDAARAIVGRCQDPGHNLWSVRVLPQAGEDADALSARTQAALDDLMANVIRLMTLQHGSEATPPDAEPPTA